MKLERITLLIFVIITNIEVNSIFTLAVNNILISSTSSITNSKQLSLSKTE